MQLLQQPFISTEKIKEKIRDLGKQISKDYEGKSIVVISVLKGAFVFTADLIRHLDIPLDVEFIGISSYQGTSSTGQVRITCDLTCEVENRHVLLLEDIIDTGKTIDYLMDVINVRKPASLKIGAFLSKPECHLMKHHIDYVGFEIENQFVVGYGLDLDGKYRELPYLAQLKEAKGHIADV